MLLLKTINMFLGHIFAVIRAFLLLLLLRDSVERRTSSKTFPGLRKFVSKQPAGLHVNVLR